MVNKKLLAQKKLMQQQLSTTSASQSEAEQDQPPLKADPDPERTLKPVSSTSSFDFNASEDAPSSKPSLSTILSEDALPPHPRPTSVYKSVTGTTNPEVSYNPRLGMSNPPQPTKAHALAVTSTHLVEPGLTPDQRSASKPHQFQDEVEKHSEPKREILSLSGLGEPSALARRNSEAKVAKWIPTVPTKGSEPEKILPNPFQPAATMDSQPPEYQEESPPPKSKSIKPNAFVRRKRTHSHQSSSSNGEETKIIVPKSSGQMELTLRTGPTSSRRRSSSSQSTQKGNNSIIDLQSKVDPVSATQGITPEGFNPFELLIEDLKLERVFYDPELDVLNRFCLEYTELCQQTFKGGLFVMRQTSHFERVYQRMKHATEDASTPVVDGHPPVSIPVLHYGLFLDHFRASSTRIRHPRVPLPHFTHGHRLTIDRYKSIVEGIFRRRLYLASSVGVSQQSLDDIM
jgi:hypothetical protein